MLILSLILSWILLLLANLAAWRPQHSPAWAFVVPFVLFGILFTFGPMGLLFSPPVALEFLLLGVALVACFGLRLGPRHFVPLSGLATLVAFGIPGWFVWGSQQEYSRLRQRFPYESMEQRLPPPGSTSHVDRLPELTDLRLTILEEQIGERKFSRAHYLKQLHEDTVGLFVNSPGFGVARLSQPSEWNLTTGVREERSLPQPGTPFKPSVSPGDLEREARDADEATVYDMHKASVLDFVHPEGFGFYKDRRHVAGFESHRFRSTPGASEPWKLQTVDLVGLLMHDEPVVYVSAHLPRMGELREAPTRPLGAFESVGLSALRRGDELFVRERAGGLQMLGAIRAAKQCTACHGCERGDLLGAFSYTLRREGR
jgi:hypothetical protein